MLSCFSFFFFIFLPIQARSEITLLSPMRVNKRTAMHNIFDSAFLKGYFFPFRIRSVQRCKRRQWEAAGLDVLRRVSATLTFAFLSVTVSRNVCKARRCGMQSSKLMEGSSEVIRAHVCAPACKSFACARQHKPKGRAPPAGQPSSATACVLATMCHRQRQTTARGPYAAC